MFGLDQRRGLGGCTSPFVRNPQDVLEIKT